MRTREGMSSGSALQKFCLVQRTGGSVPPSGRQNRQGGRRTTLPRGNVAAQRKRRCPSRLRLRCARGRSSRSPAPRAPRSSAHGAVRARRSAEEEPGPASGRAGDPAWPAASLPGACPAGDGCGIRAGLCAGLQGGWRRRVSGHQVSRGDAQMPAGPCGLSSAVLRASGVLYRLAWHAALSSRSPPASRATLSSRNRRMRPPAA